MHLGDRHAVPMHAPSRNANSEHVRTQDCNRPHWSGGARTTATAVLYIIVHAPPITAVLTHLAQRLGLGQLNNPPWR
eukprot:m.55096 g.55096  ORF g.55096 m.55096 type:complete len:77 (-) comp16853_c0_seq2:13-243(-)